MLKRISLASAHDRVICSFANAGPHWIIKLFFILNSAAHEIKLLINTEIAKINGNFRFGHLSC